MVEPVVAIAGLVHDVMADQRPVGDVGRDIDPPEPVDPTLPHGKVEPVAVAVELGIAGETEEYPAIGPASRLQLGDQGVDIGRRDKAGERRSISDGGTSDASSRAWCRRWGRTESRHERAGRPAAAAAFPAE